MKKKNSIFKKRKMKLQHFALINGSFYQSLIITQESTQVISYRFINFHKIKTPMWLACRGRN